LPFEHFSLGFAVFWLAPLQLDCDLGLLVEF
jgi:hypothetical protein